jgi:transposase-like protein
LLTLLHLDGISFRSLSDQYHLSIGTVYNTVSEYLKNLPHVADVTRKYCSHFSGILEVDGKFVKVKGYDRKLPVIYGIDYQTHDIPTYKFSETESYRACLSFFSSLRLLNYPLQAIVCDENTNIFEAARYVYPNVVVQLCQNHYKENVRRSLDLTVNQYHLPFMKLIEELFIFKRSPDDFNRAAKNIYNQFKSNPLCVQIMIDIDRHRPLLLGWRSGHNVPTTNNLIECFNSHLQGRLKTIKGFESFSHADDWLNGYFLRRRLKKFTGCEGKFRGLNGYNSLQKSKKPGVEIPPYFS